VKFLCDKCKTRYSIGDDRVRGKILKIRCKNCANVITVREGMDIAPNEPRRNPTQMIQAVQVTETAPQHGAPATQGALGAAFASQLAKPPPALEEEWYVSVDGNQQGPYSLGDAQRWVASKPFEAELHCWSEGFDDWLPVDKVSHFRNLRKKPERRAPTMPPPIPKGPRPEEPKALFAATMASIEKSAGVAPEKPAMPRVTTPARGRVEPLATKANGTGRVPSMQLDDSGEQMTVVDEPKPAVAPIMDDGDDEDDGLEIGEVSRVVKLADLAAMTRSKTPSQSPANRNPTQSNPALRNSTQNVAALRTGMTGSHQKLSPSELGMNVDPALAALAPAGAPAPDESIVARSFAARHRRGALLLITVAAVMVLGVIVAVVFAVSGGQDDLPIGLGGTRVIDTSRPEDIVRKQLPPPPNAGSNVTTTPKPRITTNRPTNPILQPEEPDTGPGSKLDAVEVETMAAKSAEGTNRCYMRAQKGALGFEIAETKKIDVTLTVAKNGTVSEVLLSKHGNNEFGQCLIARIKGWKFRESKGGTFRFALVFSAS
jgi:predicted Zn finger-like uncharacterized protein